MLEEGLYPGRAVEWAVGESSNGTPQVAILFDVFNDAGQKLAQRTHYAFLSEKAFERTIETLRACGWKGTDLSNLEGLDANEVQLVVEHNTYQGKTTDKIAFVNRAGGLALKTPMQGDKLKAFAAKMRGSIIALDKSKGEMPAPPKTIAEERQTPDEDIPF